MLQASVVMEASTRRDAAGMTGARPLVERSIQSCLAGARANLLNGGRTDGEGGCDGRHGWGAVGMRRMRARCWRALRGYRCG